jgi:hypothetical protein
VNGVVAISSLDFVGSRTLPGVKGVVEPAVSKAIDSCVADVGTPLAAELNDVVSGFSWTVVCANCGTNLCLDRCIAAGVLSKKVIAGVGRSVMLLAAVSSVWKIDGTVRNTGLRNDQRPQLLSLTAHRQLYNVLDKDLSHNWHKQLFKRSQRQHHLVQQQEVSLHQQHKSQLPWKQLVQLHPLLQAMFWILQNQGKKLPPPHSLKHKGEKESPYVVLL